MKICLTSDTHYGFTPNKTAKHLNKLVKDIAKEKPDIVLHAGDWGSDEQIHLEKCVKLFRRELGDTTIVGCLGNHDYWVGSKESYSTVKSIEARWVDLSTHYRICDIALMRDEVDILAYNSWYKTARPPSNDWRHIPLCTDKAVESENIGVFEQAIRMHRYLIDKSRKECDKVCKRLRESKANTKIVLTHFQASGAYRGNDAWDGMNGSESEYNDLMDAGANIICYGHTHRASDYVNGRGVRIINCGADYDEPAFITFEV